MKRDLLLLCIISFLLTGFSSCAGTGNVAQTVTKAPDGTTTTTSVPVASPEEVLFQERCAQVLERRFE